jgi:hypothetical protein
MTDKATAEDGHRYQLWLASIGMTVPTVNVSATACGSSSRCFFRTGHGQSGRGS